MKRILVFGLAFLLMSFSACFAIPSDADFLPAQHEWLWGFQFDHIAKRDFNKVEGQASSSQYFIKTSYGLFDDFFIDGKAGWGDMTFDRKSQDKLALHGVLQEDTDSDTYFIIIRIKV